MALMEQRIFEFTSILEGASEKEYKFYTSVMFITDIIYSIVDLIGKDHRCLRY
jgi:hypothetical protein